MIKKFLPQIFFLIAIFIYFFYYYISFYTNNFNYLFENVTSGQDFFQIPNAVYAFLNGGNLTGELINKIEPYTACCGVNKNVYHPFFTFVIGIFLIQFSPWNAFNFWILMHILFTFLLFFYVWKNYSRNSNFYLALAFYLFNSFHFYEIKHAQYHFLLSFFTFLLLSELIKNKNNYLTGILYFLTLLVKPIGFLWLIPLIIYKKYKTVLTGITLFTLLTIPFVLIDQANYYISNIINISGSIYPNYNLLALIRIINVDPSIFKYLSFFTFIFLFVIQILKKPSIFKIVFLWIGFQLIFYSFVFHYHYSILGVLFMLGILNKEFSITKIEIIPMFFLTIPAPVIIFRLIGDPAILPDKHLAVIALWSVFWLTFLMMIIIYRILFNKK
jgi:hypothetical protein